MSQPTPNPSALTSRSSPTSSRPDRKPLLPSPIARSARAAAVSGAQGLQSPQVNRSIPTVELGGNKSLFGSFRSLGPNTRIVFGLVLGAVGLAGLMVDRNVLQDEKGEEKAGISVRMVDRKV
ncbi:hypothetical protein I302_108762 [Kwoniella bestiolae CBS 10118]|uniref:Uncharacterized protein n=1 Tax=Kwoniella bestiolae CBS 10118 TaxID=1296100 RepID=A0A1B9FU08_9TREE|nr:hypothetical protein I302_07899 [Kwoniella bestiolae CBS 10118]OCF22254.1 hypothetical protein I302_07899 [Kwoniella bestiolae CBS 10118]